MKIKVLGCSGAEFPGSRPPSFLLNGNILLDTGSLTNVLDLKSQLKIEHIFITHSHLDHIMGIPFLADNLIFGKKWHKVNILSIPPVIRAIKKNLLDGSIWPDFTVIPDTHAAILNLTELKPGQPIKLGNYTITPYPVNHSVPATGYLVEDERKKRLFYTGDTGPTDATWKKLMGKQIHSLFIETSFPNRMEDIAIRTGHLTPKLLEKELLKMKHPPGKIYITHIKTQYLKPIKIELQRLSIKNLRVLRDGEIIEV
jgi:ribonuclease BN (tRNA processing enzyme)